MTEQIKAYVRMEERYEGLCLIFGDNPNLKSQVLETIEEVKSETGMKPMVFENISNDDHGKDAFYIEFNDDVQRDAGDFFERVLSRLHLVCSE
jgi:hypothetical protein